MKSKRNLVQTVATRAVFLFGLIVILGGTLGSRLKSDEEVTFFPQYAYRSSDGDTWRFRIHAWVYEPEEGSRSRAMLLNLLSGRLGLNADETESAVFKDRARYFLVDNESQKRIEIRIGGSTFEVGPSGANGHIETEVSVLGNILTNSSQIGFAKGITSAVVEMDNPNSAAKKFSFRVPLIENKGISIISDLDDTVKVSDVRSKRALLANTFLSEFKPVDGMAELYARWAERGAAFHYVSASPWQLFPSLSTFLHSSGFPSGSLSLKTFRWKDSSFFDLFAKSNIIKKPMIEQILKDFPSREFVLVGDTGELDSELYAELVREYSTQIRYVFIRKSASDVTEEARCRRAFTGIDSSKWKIFDKASELSQVALFK